MKNKEEKRSSHSYLSRTHGPRKLITAHPESIHGGGEAPGGRSSLQQGVGKRSAGAPDLGSAAATEQRRDREKGFCLRGFRVTGNK